VRERQDLLVGAKGHGPGAAAAAVTSSLELPEFVKADSELGKKFVEEGRPDLTAPVHWNRNRPPISMNPALMASSLSSPLKT